mmetsp:Transcript_25883/g.73657  ORF Transcript_25883/g.73657 Transcript_25883/m.73657 type:complete len:227 (+) Transcript_25883:263-943(+)
MGDYDPCDVSIVSLGSTDNFNAQLADAGAACAAMSLDPLETVQEKPIPEKNSGAWDLSARTSEEASKASTAKSWFSNPFRKGSKMQQHVETVEVSAFGMAPSPSTPTSGKTSSVGIGGTGTVAAAAVAQAAVVTAISAPGVVPSRSPSSSHVSLANATVAGDALDVDSARGPRSGGAGWDLAEPLHPVGAPVENAGHRWFRPMGIRGNAAESETQVTAFEGRPESP